VVSRRPLIRGFRVQSQASECGSSGGRCPLIIIVPPILHAQSCISDTIYTSQFTVSRNNMFLKRKLMNRLSLRLESTLCVLLGVPWCKSTQGNICYISLHNMCRADTLLTLLNETFQQRLCKFQVRNLIKSSQVFDLRMKTSAYGCFLIVINFVLWNSLSLMA
jgi:hypothetical protein